MITEIKETEDVFYIAYVLTAESKWSDGTIRTWEGEKLWLSKERNERNLTARKQWAHKFRSQNEAIEAWQSHSWNSQPDIILLQPDSFTVLKVTETWRMVRDEEVA